MVRGAIYYACLLEQTGMYGQKVALVKQRKEWDKTKWPLLQQDAKLKCVSHKIFFSEITWYLGSDCVKHIQRWKLVHISWISDFLARMKDRTENGKMMVLSNNDDKDA